MKKILRAIILSAGAVIILAGPVLALVAQPSGVPTFQSVAVFRNLAETGDMLAVYHTRVPYGTYPDTPASVSMVNHMYEADGITLINTTTPHVFVDFETNGYGDNIGSFYFDAENAPAWGGSYVLNIGGLPGFYSPEVSVPYTLGAEDYSTANASQETQRLDMYNYIIGLTDTFKRYYPDVVLKATSDSGNVLSSVGESYFRSVIPGLGSLNPTLFYVQAYIPQVMEHQVYDVSQGETYRERLAGTDIMRGVTRLGSKFGATGLTVAGVFSFIMCVVICILCMRRGWGIEPGLLISGVVITGAALLFGDVLSAVIMIIGLVSAMGIMYIIFQKKA